MKNQSFVTVNGQNFHYFWLRDNCLCEQDYHSISCQRFYDFSERPEPKKPKSVEFGDEQLIIDWDEEPPHRSVFPLSWLMSNGYQAKPDPKSSDEILLWDRAKLDAQVPQWFDANCCSQELWMEQLFSLGLTIIRNLAFEDLESFLSAVGPIQETMWGKFTSIKITPEAKDLAYLGGALSPHNDFSYTSSQRLVQILYCVKQEAIGGESIVVDGFRVVRDFRQQYPLEFEILTNTIVKFKHIDRENQYEFSHESPILKLDREGEVAGICFSHKNCIRDVPFEQAEAFYKAYAIFFNLLKNRDYQYRYYLQPGDCLLVQNARVLDGRTEFDPSSGQRHLEVGYMDWDYFVARQKFLSNQKTS